MAIESMSTFDAVLKIDYLPVLQQQFNKEIILYNRVKRDKENVEGKKYLFPVHSAWGETTGAITELGTIPAPGNESTAESSGTLQTVMGKFQVSTKVIAATKSDKGSFVRAVDMKLRNVADNLKKDLNWMVQSDGTGALAKITVGANSVTLTLDNSLPVRINMLLNAWSAKVAGTQRTGGGNDRTVTNINYDTHVMTINAAWTDQVVNDYIFKSTGRGINVMGLLGIVDDATFVGVLQGIDRSTSAYWNASVLGNSGTNRALTQVLLQGAEDKPYIKAGGKISAFFSNLGQRQNYVQLVTADRRYINTLKFDAGYEALEYNGKPWFVDRDAYKNVVFALDESVLRFAMMDEIGWMDDDGAVLARESSQLAYSATLHGVMELITYQPNRHSVIRDLSEPAGY